jgi:hypothetical protein
MDNGAYERGTGVLLILEHPIVLGPIGNIELKPLISLFE